MSFAISLRVFLSVGMLGGHTNSEDEKYIIRTIRKPKNAMENKAIMSNNKYDITDNYRKGFCMQCNVGERDAIIRITVGSVIVMLAITFHSWLAALVGIALLYNGFTRKCYLFKYLKVNSLKGRIEDNDKKI